MTLIPRNIPCPEKFLVAPLHPYISCPLVDLTKNIELPRVRLITIVKSRFLIRFSYAKATFGLTHLSS